MSDDLIKRKDVIATLGVMYERCDTYDITDYRDLMLEAVKVLPSADRPQGEWIMSKPEEDGFGAVFQCSRCSYEVDCVPTNFCPNCGCDMRGGSANER